MTIHNAPVLRTWFMLKITYAIVPIILGLDKCFTGMIVDWAKYVSPLALNCTGLTIPQFLIAIGVIEIVAGLLVWFYPRLGAYVIVAWMLLIIINLASMNTFYDIIARDIVIAIGALALAWLSDAIQQ